ncbi:MAG: hypothetical protein ACLTKZ_02160 [Lachnospiraceae bacterium]
MTVFILSRLVSLAALPEGESKQPETYEYRLPFITSLCEELPLFALFSSKRKSEKGKPFNKDEGFYPLSARFTRHSTCRACLSATQQGFPKGKARAAASLAALLKVEVF